MCHAGDDWQEVLTLSSYSIKLLQPSHVSFRPSFYTRGCKVITAFEVTAFSLPCLSRPTSQRTICLYPHPSISHKQLPRMGCWRERRKKAELHRNSQKASNSKYIFWHLPAHTSLPKANKTTVEKKHCLTCTHSQVSGAAWVDRMRSVGVGGRRETDKKEAKRIYYLSKISQNNLCLSLFFDEKRCIHLCVYILHERTIFSEWDLIRWSWRRCLLVHTHTHRNRNVLSPVPKDMSCAHINVSRLLSLSTQHVEITGVARDGKRQNKCNNKRERAAVV